MLARYLVMQHGITNFSNVPRRYLGYLPFLAFLFPASFWLSRCRLPLVCSPPPCCCCVPPLAMQRLLSSAVSRQARSGQTHRVHRASARAQADTRSREQREEGSLCCMRVLAVIVCASRAKARSCSVHCCYTCAEATRRDSCVGCTGRARRSRCSRRCCFRCVCCCRYESSRVRRSS